ncbi:MAG: PEP-CTERM sorting domain-containing protein [Burkholderiales bacterium]|jgi:hypothetical protein|nr:PEP-CTERM sorting domain-containing protein [Burkholderiales bacterium]
MRSSLALVALATGLAAFDAAAAAPSYITIDQTNIGNGQFASSGFIGGSAYPTGDQTFLGVPFALPGDKLYMWHSAFATGPNPRSIEIPVGLAGVDRLHTLMGTWWGERADGAYASITFVGTGVEDFTVMLDGGVHIRDYNYNPTYTTTLGAATEVWNSTGTVGAAAGQHIDMQVFDLPDRFLTTTLEKIIVTDDGGEGFQRVFIAASTAYVVPEPSTVAMLAAGVALLGASARRRARAART